MDRRRYLQTIGTGMTVGLAGLAGCGSPGDGGGEEGQDGTGGTEPGEEGEGVANNESDGQGDQEGGGEGGGGATEVAMVTEGSEYYFDPIGLYVESGTEVTWVNDSGSHSSTAYVEDNPQAETRLIPEDAEGWDSGTLSEQGAEFSHTFETEGTYDYYCIPHKSLEMVGRVVVGEPGGPAAGSQPPDGEVPESDLIVEEGTIPYDELGGE